MSSNLSCVGGLVALALALPFAAGCSGAQGGAPVSPSTSQAAYAAVYPDLLGTTVKNTEERVSTARAVIGHFSEYPPRLKKVDPKLVAEIAERADEAGRSGAYVEREREADDVHTFFDEERGNLSGRVSGAANYAAKQANCEADVGGPASYAMAEGVDKQLEKRLRVRSEAFILIERYRLTVGQEAAQTLEKMADGISLASYLVHVDLVDRRARLGRLAADRGSVKSTAARFVEDEKSFQSRAKTDAEKKASEGRIQVMTKSSGAIDASADAAEKARTSLDQTIKDLQKQYDDGLKDLVAKLGT